MPPAKTESVLIFQDAAALARYVEGAGEAEPALISRPCESLVLKAEGDARPRPALRFEGAAPPAPPADEGRERARLVRARIDAAARALFVVEGIQVKERFTIVESRARPNVVQAVALEPWPREPEDPEVVFMVGPGAPFAALVTEHLELGKDDLRVASVKDERGAFCLLEVPRPSWFVLERWTDTHHHQGNGTRTARAFRRIPRRRVCLAWGLRHPLERFLPDPEGEESLLFIEADATYRVLRPGAWKDVGESLALDARDLDAPRFAAAPEPGRVAVRLRLEGRPKPRDPELWLLPEEERGRLEKLLAQTPEEELKNLLVALVERAGSGRWFAVREAIAGRGARLLPVGGRAYAPVPGLGGLYLPTDRTLAPPLRNDRYARAFGVRPGELTLLDDKGDGSIAVTKLDETAFRPMDAVVDFVVDSEAARLEAVLAKVPFDLGRFAEEDLVAPGGGERRAREKAPRETKEEETPAKGEERPAAEGDKGLLSALRGMFGQRPRPAEPDRKTAPATTPAREAEVDALERELADRPDDIAAWASLGDVRFEQDDVEEGLRCGENALWLVRDATAEQPLRARFRDRLGPPADRNAPHDLPGLWRLVLAFADESATSRDRERVREAIDRVYGFLRAFEGQLRKKSRWLLWREVVKITNDKIEEERQREEVIAELVLRGVEDREVPGFVRRRLLERYSTAAAQGADRAAEALAFLAEAESFADAFDKPAHRAAGLANVAWAYAELGQVERARELARAAVGHAQDAKAEPDRAYRARALARVAAVNERTDGSGAGRRLLLESLELIAKGLEPRSGRGGAEERGQEHAEARKALVKWFRALADARGAQADREDPVIARGLERLESVEPPLRALLVDDCSDALVRLGQTERGRAIARALLARSDLSLMYLEHAAAALEAFEEGRSAAPDDGRRIFDVVRRAPQTNQEIDEFAPAMILVALRGERRPPWEVADELAQELARAGQPYAALLIRYTALRRLAELRDRERGPRLLVRLYEQAVAHEAPQTAGGEERQRVDEQRMRVITRLAQLIPAFGLRDQGLEILKRIRDRASQERSLYVQKELLSACALAASKLGESRESVGLVESVVDRALTTLREARSDQRQTTTAFLFDALDSATAAVAELGDAARGLALIGRVAHAAREALNAREDPHRSMGESGAGRYYYIRALIRCGEAAVAIGGRDAAQGYFDDALGRLPDTFRFDRIDLLQETAKAANQLEGSARYALAARVLELARGVLDLGEYSRQFVVDLTESVAQDVVRGESGFAAALKRWKGEEERRIRDRVATERVAR